MGCGANLLQFYPCTTAKHAKPLCLKQVPLFQQGRTGQQSRAQACGGRLQRTGMGSISLVGFGSCCTQNLTGSQPDFSCRMFTERIGKLRSATGRNFLGTVQANRSSNDGDHPVIKI